MLNERYIKNLGAFNEDELNAVREKSVCIAGCGGLGGHAAEMLARFGVGRLTIIDGDTFNITNINRQRFCNEATIGVNKASAAKRELEAINADVCVNAVDVMLTKQNAEKLLCGHDIAIDCLDNTASRFILDKACKRLNMPYVHGAIGGFSGHVSVIFPGDKTLESIYGENTARDNNDDGNPAFTPALVAAVQCAEAVKCLLGKGGLLRNKILYVDLLYGDFEVIE